MQCIQCGKQFFAMFVCWIRGAKHLCCASYPMCQAKLAERMNTVDRLTAVAQ